MKWYEVKLMVGIQEGTYKHWDCSCDEAVVASQFHDPDNNVYCTYYAPTTENKVSDVKHNIFDEFGGI